MKHLEIEFKNLLTKEEFEQIKAHFSLTSKDFILQVNDYFDTPDFSLKSLGSALRIRKKLRKYELTLKEPRKTGLLETNEWITKEDAELLINEKNFPNGEVNDRLLALQIDPKRLKYFGSLSTLRAEVHYLNGILVLDQSSYFQKTDYEVEYEVDHAETGKQHFFEFLQLFNIPKRKTVNKVARLYEEKIRIKNHFELEF